MLHFKSRWSNTLDERTNDTAPSTRKPSVLPLNFDGLVVTTYLPPLMNTGSDQNTALIGCLLDVSGSMKNALESGEGDERATERLHAVLRAALKLARAEQVQSPDALMFVGAFGLHNERTPVVDLCSLVDALIDHTTGEAAEQMRTQTGHELLIGLANENTVPHVSKYIQTRLSEHQARVVYMHLRRHPDNISEFLRAIPHPITTVGMEYLGKGLRMIAAPVQGAEDLIGGAENYMADNAEALVLARKICDDWLLEFQDLTPRPVSDVIPLLERLQEHPGTSEVRDAKLDGRTLLDELRSHMYGRTPMRAAMTKTLALFRQRSDIEQRVLVLISDGESTDGDPIPLANEMKKENIAIAGIFLTSDTKIPRRKLYDQVPKGGLSQSQSKLLAMASNVSVTKHPIPVLASIGWEVPSSGECALYTAICSSDALEEFCSVLLSARFGSADALLDILGKVQLDAYVNDEHIKTCNNPSNQGQTSTCYAHAIASVLHMALLRIVDRDGGYPSITEIRERILRECPPGPHGRVTQEVLEKAIGWYRPLRFRLVDEEGAREAVVRRRPVVAAFRLTEPGWQAFKKHFGNPRTRNAILSKAHTSPFLSDSDGGGHAVVLIRCDPRSLTFLNSWGYDWGNNGSFSVEDASTLQVKPTGPMLFWDVYWLDNELTTRERQAFDTKVNEDLRNRAAEHPSIFELEMLCPRCCVSAPIANFTGNVRSAICPLCRRSFKPEPGYLVQALYAKAGLSNIV